MKFGMVIYQNKPDAITDLTVAAEEAGWDGAFIADGLAVGTRDGRSIPWFDPWVVLGLMAAGTKSIRIGTFIAAVPRRRPWKLAREAETVDQISTGRLILGVGLGAAKDDGGFCKVGEPMDLKTRAELLDEGLEIMAGLWTGKKFTFKGQHYGVDAMTMLPGPVQSPRIPIWVVGVWPKMKSIRRALRWDGIIPQMYKATGADITMTAEDVDAIRKFIYDQRGEAVPFDLVVGGSSSGKNPKRAAETVRPYVKAGATWWMEHNWASNPATALKRIKQGPPPLHG